MKRIAWMGAASVAVLIAAAPAAAADKAQQQLMAELRMLQQQQQQLHQLVGGLADTLKTMTAKLEEQTGANRKSFADQKLLVDNVAEGVRVLREKADDTNVRLSSMTQELEAVRQAIATMPAPAAAPAQEPLPGGAEQTPGASPPAGGQPPVAVPTPARPGAQLISPQRMFDNAYGDYTGGYYDIAIIGFNNYINTFPQSDKADDAQLNIGQALHASGKFREAVEAFQKVLANYPQSDSVPVAYYKMGLTYEALKQLDLARKAFETVMERHPAAPEATLARQRLDSLKGKQE
jgi:tol-pal system protein YbgF